LKFENQYIIQFKGLKEGVHNFEFTLGKAFFAEFEFLEVPDGKVHARIVLTRNPTFMDLDINLNGSIQALCDRCLGYFDLDVDYIGHLVVRFSEQEKEGDDEIIFLHPDEHQLDLKHYFYECISVSIPYRKVHPDLRDGQPGCDPDMLKKLKDHLIEE
jgi:uncharacterized metal-binding protein YceD (DUF177 family)